MLRYLSTALLVAAVSPAAAHGDTLGESSMPSAVHAYRDTVIWNARAAGAPTYTLMVHTGGATRALPLTGRREVDATVGRGSDGRPLIVYAACPSSRCGLYGIRPDGSGSRLLARTTHARTPAYSPALWRDRLVWVEGGSRGTEQVATARIGRRPSVIQRYRGIAVEELALLGNKLALSVITDPNGIEEAEVWLQSLRARTPRVLEAASVGESGRALIGLSFSHGALYFAKICYADASGCGGRGTAFRYRGRTRSTARIPVDLAGFSYFGTSAYWMTENFGECLDEEGEDAPCKVEQTKLAFS